MFVAKVRYVASAFEADAIRDSRFAGSGNWYLLHKNAPIQQVNPNETTFGKKIN